MKLLIKQSKKIFQDFKFELFAYKTNLKGVRKAKKFKNLASLKLHLASGIVNKADWINIDLHSKMTELNLDLRRKLPFKDNSIDEIYSEHFLEHLEYPDEALSFLKELYRIIKPNKIVSCGVPDSCYPMKSYVEGENAEYFKNAKSSGWHPETCETIMDQINFHFRQEGEHKYAYDAQSLINIHKKAGFQNVDLRDFNPEIDSESRQPGTIYCVAIKEI